MFSYEDELPIKIHRTSNKEVEQLIQIKDRRHPASMDMHLMNQDLVKVPLEVERTNSRLLSLDVVQKLRIQQQQQ